MSTRTADILLHPVRLRIVLALGSDHLTTADLQRHLPDVAQATLYRQVAALVDAGLLEVVDERQVRGGVERTYALVASAAAIDPAEAVAMTSEEHLSGFVTFVGALIGAFGRYLADPATNLAEDSVGYRQAAIWVDDAERTMLVSELAAILAPFLVHEPRAGRERVLLNTILIPDVTAVSAEG